MFSAETPLLLPAGGFITAAGHTSASPSLAWCRFDRQQWHAGLYPQWQLPLPFALQQAASKRKIEYLASRWLVRQHLAQLGISDFVLHNAPDRSPCWPAGIRASLSHSHDCVVVAATRANLCVGIDVEQVMAEETAQETAELLMNAQERALLEGQPLPFAQAATLLFSLKESLYKALWPQLHQPMAFHQAALIALDLPQQRARLQLRQDFSAAFNRSTVLDARFWLQPTRVVTLLTHPAGTQ
ncbi:4'-phosphopantetheinyl transferase family protein [Pantoea dispersa]|uniref:4'-phosphopantetheinyl transferase family protein n=1 Tax=Pantoea dispersa TaxID=59814 RepID=UPI002DC04302|nr:4'-phosphopantetheinyl transferase superfamily protein [Pantoea dispersa]MEB5972497.1 4'-phosphopantetheinyl transferase superfamily protein [Pantoea dispersa]